MFEPNKFGGVGKKKDGGGRAPRGRDETGREAPCARPRTATGVWGARRAPRARGAGGPLYSPLAPSADGDAPGPRAPSWGSQATA